MIKYDRTKRLHEGDRKFVVHKAVEEETLSVQHTMLKWMTCQYVICLDARKLDYHYDDSLILPLLAK